MEKLSFIKVAALPSVLEPNSIYQVGNLLYSVEPNGNPVLMGPLAGSVGQVALVAGTKAITIAGLTTTSKVFLQLATPNTASSTIQYKGVCSANTLTITALIAAGTINASDISTVNYVVFD